MSGTADTELRDALARRGLRATSQRLVINRVLREQDRHLSAEAVLDAVADRLPGVSLPTVYATLDLLEELGLARRVPGGHAQLYDGRRARHDHLVCRRCGAVADLDAALDVEP